MVNSVVVAIDVYHMEVVFAVKYKDVENQVKGVGNV